MAFEKVSDKEFRGPPKEGELYNIDGLYQLLETWEARKIAAQKEIDKYRALIAEGESVGVTGTKTEEGGL